VPDSMNARAQFERDKALAPQGPSRWPGAATRIQSGTRTGEIDWRKGRVIAVSDLSIDVEMDHPLYKKIKLLGDAYIHFCRQCKASIPGNVTYKRDPEFRAFCPYCGPGFPLENVKPGDWLRLHHRSEIEEERVIEATETYRGWANWYGEIWEW
jgi:hypothetical protein